MLRAGREHAVRLVGALGAKVIYHHADVGLVAAKDDGFLVPQPARGVDAGHDALPRGFFVTRGAIDLAREPDAFQSFYRKIPMQLQRVKTVVLDGVTGTYDFRLLEPRETVNHALLHIRRHGRGQPRKVDFFGLQALRFHKNLVPRLVRKLYEFVLDAGAVARTDAFDMPTIHRRAVQVFAHRGFGFGCGVDDVAGHLGLGNSTL